MTQDDAHDATKALRYADSRIDKALATVVATKSVTDRYFIGEALLAGATLFLLNRYAGAYVDRLGLKATAESHADATGAFLKRLKDKQVDAADHHRQLTLLQEALDLIRSHGASQDVAEAAKRHIVQELVRAGAIEAQAEATAELLSTSVREGMGGP